MKVFQEDMLAIKQAIMGALKNATDGTGLRGGGRLPDDGELESVIVGALITLARDHVSI